MIRRIYLPYIRNSMGKEQLGQVLRKRRKELAVTQTQLAEYAGLSLNTVYQIERGQANPTLETLMTLADTLGLQLDLRAKVMPA